MNIPIKTVTYQNIKRTRTECIHSCYALNFNKSFCNHFKKKLKNDKTFFSPGEYDMIFIPCTECNELFIFYKCSKDKE